MPLTVKVTEALCALVFVIVVVLVLIQHQEPHWNRVEDWFVALIGIGYVGCGAFMLLDAGQRANGSLLVLFGILFSLSEFTTAGRAAWIVVLISLSAPFGSVCLGTVLLRYPENRLASLFERWFVVSAVLYILTFAALIAAVWPIVWSNVSYDEWPRWLPYDLEARLRTVYNGGSAVIYLGFAVLLIVRIARTRGLDRRVYMPIHIASAFAGLVALADAVAVTRGVVRSAGNDRYSLYLNAALLAIPLLLVISSLQRRLMRMRITTLVTRINAAPTSAEVESALRGVFADPRLMLLFWSAEHHDYVGVDGVRSPSEVARKQMVVDLPNRDGSPLARVLMDQSAAHYVELLEATKAASGLALENAALQSSLLTTLDQVHESQQEGETLSRLLPTGLAEILRRDGAHVGKSERLEVTVLMSDVRGYSAIAEQRDPTSLAAQLNTHRREMNRVIIEQGGTVMQYVGDAVMAVFGAPVASTDHADDALAAALAMHAAQRRINEVWVGEGLPAFGLGIGLSTGEVAAALLGSDERIEYTLVGDTVNLAHRLQDLARPAGSTVVSEATWHQLTTRPDDIQWLPAQLVKGRHSPVNCYRMGVS
jgi:class 3 adenylate cyclase